MREIKITIVAEVVEPWGTVTVELSQAHRANRHGSLRSRVDTALLSSVDQVRDMYRCSGRAVRHGS